jgi:hypothetical protein
MSVLRDKGLWIKRGGTPRRKAAQKSEQQEGAQQRPGTIILDIWTYRSQGRLLVRAAIYLKTDGMSLYRGVLRGTVRNPVTEKPSDAFHRDFVSYFHLLGS